MTAEPNMNFSWQDTFKPTVLLAIALMAIIVMMVLPMPAWILDIGLAASFALAILMFTITLFIERPLEFSAFPTVLLASLMLRLSLNVSSTKLIIGQGHTGTGAAGNVILGFAKFIMGGSVVLGLVVFGVLLIVNFIVITKGATRMAEVGARFALDGMPGKQLAIDGDMAAGAIDHTEAKNRRERELAETTFFGSLDGASKFVKGDAVAGLLITILNLVMGLVMGVVFHDMPLLNALETYAMLTVGDGLVTQFPALIISIATALLLARSGATGSADVAIFSQLGNFPAALWTVSVLMAFFALLPGLPFFPFLIGALILTFAGWVARNAKKQPERKGESNLQEKESEIPPTLGDLLDLDDIHIEFAPDLVSMIVDSSTGLEARIENIRKYIAETFGIIIPEIRLTDDVSLRSGEYVIRIQGVQQASDFLQIDQVLALLNDEVLDLPEGVDVKEPVYGAPARWVAQNEHEALALRGVTLVNPAEVLATHLLEVLKQNLARLLGMKSLRRLLAELVELSDPVRSEANRKLFDELIPDKVPMDALLATLKLLLEERVSIRNFALILEAIAESRPTATAPEQICEHVRQKLGFQITAELRRDDGSLPLIQLATEWEEKFSKYQHDSGRTVDIALPPDEFNRLGTLIAEKLAKAGENGVYPALITNTQRRRYLKTVIDAKGLPNPVLSYDEIGTNLKPALVGLVPA